MIAIFAIGLSGLDLGYWRFASVPDILRVIGVATATSISTTTLIFAFNRLEGIARTIPILQLVLIIIFLAAPRFVARLIFRARKRVPPFSLDGESKRVQTVLIAGMTALAEFYLKSLAEIGDGDIRIAGIVSPQQRQVGRFMGRYRVLGTLDNIAHVISGLAVHGVIVERIVVAIAPHLLSAEVRTGLAQLEARGTLTIDYLAQRISGVPREADDGEAAQANRCVPGAGRSTGRSSIASQENAFAFRQRDLDAMARARYWRLKRVMDVFGASFLLMLLLPIGLVAAALATIDLGWPLFFWQERLGAGGRTFKLYKLRTMAAALDNHGHRISDRDRLSVIGALLRRTRFDELPQIWNVLIGDMSLIGPRPLLPVDQPRRDPGRLLVRPGLTGWAQVQGGRDITADDKAALDVWFIRNASFALDFEILAATLRMVLVGERVNRDAIAKAWTESSQPVFRRAPARFKLIPRSARIRIRFPEAPQLASIAIPRRSRAPN